MQPVLTVAEMQAVDAAGPGVHPARGAGGAGPGTAVAVAALEHAGRRLRAPGGGGGRQGATTAPTVGWRRPAPGRAGRPGRGGRRPGAADRRSGPADLVIDAAYGTGFRGEYRAPAVAAGDPGAGRRHPVGGRRRHRARRPGSPLAATRTVTFVALKPGLLQGDGARLAGRVHRGRHRPPRRGARRARSWRTATSSPCSPPAAREATSGRPAVLVVAGSPGMTGAAALCARLGLPGRGRHGPPGRARRRTSADAPASEAVSVALPGRGLGRRGPRGRRRAVPGRGGRPGPRAGPTATAAEVRRLVARLAGAGGGRRRRAVRPGPARRHRLPARVGGGAHPPRRRVRAADGRRPRARPDRRRPAAGRAPRVRWPCSRGRPRRWPSPEGRVRARPGRDPGAGHRRHRRRPVRGDRRLPRPRGGPARRRPRWPPTSTVGPAAAGPTEGLVAGDLPELVSGVLSVPRPADVRRGRRRQAPWRRLIAGGRPGPTSTSTPSATTPRCWPSWPVRPRCAPWSRPTATGTERWPWPGPPWRGAPPGWPWPWSRRGWPCARPASRRPSSSCPSHRPRPMAEAVARGLVPTVYTDRGIRLGWPRGSAAGRLPRSTVHLKVDTGMHRVGADPADAPCPGRPDRRPGQPGPAGRCGPTWPWPTAPADDDRAVHPASSWTGSTPCWPQLAAAGHRPADGPRGQLGRRPSPIPGARRDLVRCGIAVYGVSPHPGPGRRAGRRHRRWPAATGPLAAGPGDLRPRPRRRGAALLRPAPAAAGDGRRWPPCPSGTPTGCPDACSTRAARC